MTETFGYDADIGENGQWEFEYYDSEKEPMTEKEFEKKLKDYEPVKIRWEVLEGFAEEENKSGQEICG